MVQSNPDLKELMCKGLIWANIGEINDLEASGLIPATRIILAHKTRVVFETN